MTDETYKMEAKEPERWQKVNIPSMSTQTVGINRTHLKRIDFPKVEVIGLDDMIQFLNNVEP